MHELCFELGDASDYCLNFGFSFDATADDHQEIFLAKEKTLTSAIGEVIFILANILNVGILTGHLIVVEEIGGIEGIFDIEVLEIRLSVLEVIAEASSNSHASNEIVSDVFSNIGIGLSTKGDLDSLMRKFGQHSLVLHEGANTALLVPDEEVLLSFLGHLEG